MNANRALVGLITCCVLATSLFAQTPTSKKKLIEFGWDEPDNVFLRQHIATMEETPFDGVVYHVLYTNKDGSTGSFMNECWGARTFTETQLSKARADLQATPFKKFTHNFLRFNVTPGDIDWFDDFTPILTNAKLAASLAKDARSAGILFDIEQYATPLFDYRKAKHNKTKSFDEYAARVRVCGRRLMEAFQEGQGDLTVFLTFAYCLPHAQVGTDKSKLASVDYGLHVPLLDGMFEAAKGNAKIVDGFEISYGYKDPKQFDDGLLTMKKKVLPLVADTDKYAKHTSAGFGIWLDNDWRKKAWNTEDFSKNHFTPEQFAASLKKALQTSDEYVWIYTETPKWWTPPNGKPEKLPAAYDNAIRDAAKQ